MNALDALRKARRVVVKVGTSNLTESNRLSVRKVKNLVDRLMALKKEGKELILVSSGAIGAGMSKLDLKQRPRDVKMLQATAAVGQNELMKSYGKCFGEYDQTVAQVLLTYEDFEERNRYLNLRNTINTLLKMNVIPVINENDTVAVDEIKLGDNDNLSALVAVNMEADLLVLISESGLHAGDPKENKKAELIPVVEKITREIEEYCGGTSALGRGGMKTKLQAARKTMQAGISMIVTSLGKDSLVSEDSTLFKASGKLSDRQHWICFTSKVKGKIVVDDGARKALLEKGCSLLPSGIVKVEGNFKKGDTVSIVDKNKLDVARGITNYSNVDVERIAGKKTSEIARVLGCKGSNEVVSRCNMVLT
ncbi:MAG: glutamate 5-kinase [Candidatus Altiarchaeales archaeon]|nr:glutamate 5-kinase [Candidatus Altiarchaeales archaeon]